MRHNAHQSDSNKFFSLQVNGTVIFPLKFSAIPKINIVHQNFGAYGIRPFK